MVSEDVKVVVAELAKFFHCGESVIARKALDSEKINKDIYNQIIQATIDNYNEVKENKLLLHQIVPKPILVNEFSIYLILLKNVLLLFLLNRKRINWLGHTDTQTTLNIYAHFHRQRLNTSDNDLSEISKASADLF